MNFHLTENEIPTLKSLHQKVVRDTDFNGSVTSLGRILKTIGFRWRKTENNRKVLIERHDIKLQRINYLESIKYFRDQNRSIVYTDETYIHSSHTISKSWTCSPTKGLKMPISKGQRLIVVHAGGSNGFVPNAMLVYKSSQKCGDYHHDMNFNNYEKWLKEKLIPNLPSNSVVVIDNAPYHNVQLNPAPTSNSRKAVMQQWLRDKNIPFNDAMLKTSLYDTIKIHKPRFKRFKVNALLEENGHTVLRLPPYHPDLNPIEEIWAQIKGYVAKKNVSFKLDDAMKHAIDKIEAMSTIDSQCWTNVCRHIIDIENNYRLIEPALDRILDNLSFVVNTGSSDEEMDSVNLDQSRSENSDTDLEGIYPLQ